METPVATCECIERGDKYKIRKNAQLQHGVLEEKEEVEIIDFYDKSRPPQCRNEKARLLKFKCKEGAQWHPAWIINCRECQFYDPTWRWPGKHIGDFTAKGERFLRERNPY